MISLIVKDIVSISWFGIQIRGQLVSGLIHPSVQELYFSGGTRGCELDVTVNHINLGVEEGQFLIPPFFQCPMLVSLY